MIKIGPLIKIFEFISKCKGHYSAKIPIVCTDKPIKHINIQICETDKMTDINLHATLMQWDLIKDISLVQTTVLTNKQAMSVILQ